MARHQTCARARSRTVIKSLPTVSSRIPPVALPRGRPPSTICGIDSFICRGASLIRRYGSFCPRLSLTDFARLCRECACLRARARTRVNSIPRKGRRYLALSVPIRLIYRSTGIDTWLTSDVRKAYEMHSAAPVPILRRNQVVPRANAATIGVETRRGADAYSYAARRAGLQACCASLQAARSITFTGGKE